jgi:hypothetical protein
MPKNQPSRLLQAALSVRPRRTTNNFLTESRATHAGNAVGAAIGRENVRLLTDPELQLQGLVQGATASEPKASVLSSRSRSAINVYVNIEYKRKTYRTLLDTGCNLFVLGSKILPELVSSMHDQSLSGKLHHCADFRKCSCSVSNCWHDDRIRVFGECCS